MLTKIARPSGFILALVCFFMPFVTLSCPMARLSFTGTQIAFGTTVQEPQMFGPAKERRIPGEPLARGAVVAAVVGAAIGLVEGSAPRWFSAGFAVAGGGSLLMLKNKIDTQAQNQTAGMMSVSYELGYWIALLGYVGALVANLLKLAPATAEPPTRDVAAATRGVIAPRLDSSAHLASTPTSSTGHTRAFCGNCGSKLDGASRFCQHCGAGIGSAL